MNTAPTAIIADDEPLLRQTLKKELAVSWPQLEIIGEAANGAEALALIAAHRPAIVFLDIQMPAMSGLEVAQQIQGRCQIVFITAYDHYAVDAFERAAIDYLLKPVQPARLQATVERLKAHTRPVAADLSLLLQQLNELKTPPPSWLQWIKVPLHDEIQLLPVDEVEYLQSSDKYTAVYSAGREYLIRTPLKLLAEQLDPERFWRIHRSTVVRADAIEKVSKDLRGRYFVTLKNYPRRLYISRGFLHRFKE